MASRGDFADFQNQFSSKQKGKDVEVEYARSEPDLVLTLRRS